MAGADDWVLILVGAAVGAVARYTIGAVVKSLWQTVIPWGTFTANVLAALVLGIAFQEGVAEGSENTRMHFLVATGLCGALSTWSTFAREVVTLQQQRRVKVAVWYLLLTSGAGLGASFAGAALAQALG
ncbi:hypothetical protein BIV57_00915 [Mangrovactinospora gilvigrisea]|uniref:Fluoride-specific ion channel FluC n=1 Tax=Mangrovactinospora gilvigrisea TaxID=1428644 RepID=A0A1J7BL62_9ACTN|nr:fluoride efflux transporter CrcB [Mangrovactinospora gilvigrisea]OIV39431.1 hypothetical protein BIV57_00915 [Mangrovactinospora gilvigrisea]